MNEKTTADLPLWADFPFAAFVPKQFEVRCGMVRPEGEDSELHVFSLCHPLSGRHVDCNWQEAMLLVPVNLWLMKMIRVLEGATEAWKPIETKENDNGI